MAKALFEAEIKCGRETCGSCEWVYGEAAGDPYCGWFALYASKKTEKKQNRQV